MEIIQEICKEGKSKKKEQKICLLSKITNIKEKKKQNKTKTKNLKKYRHLSPSKCQHETKCDRVPNHATPPTPA